MSSSHAPTAMLCMPNGYARLAVNASLVALNIDAQETMPSRADLTKISQVLQDNPLAVAVIDLAYVRQACKNILALTDVFSDPAVRRRIALTRAHRGVWPSDLNWAQELGFAGLYPELDAASLQAESSAILAWLAHCAGVPTITVEALKKHFDAAHIQSDDTSARGLIRHTTGLTAEVFCTELAHHVDTQDRIHNMSDYPQCFVGSEAVDWLMKKYAVSKDRAIRLGLALQELGLLHHAAREQEFSHGPFYFRTEPSAAVQLLSPGATYSLLTSKTGVLLQDRSYHGTNYEHCFVGSHAVDWLHAKLHLSRVDAEMMLNRLFGFDLIEHVTREHPVLDGHYFYRFVH